MKPPAHLLAFLLLLPALPTPNAEAFETRLGMDSNTVVFAEGETFETEALMLGYSVDMRGEARRDLWLGASTAVRFSGDAHGDLRLLASSAILDGTLHANLLGSARAIQLTTNSIVLGELALFGTTVVCEGDVRGNAWIWADSVTLSGRWQGNLRVQANEILVSPGTKIAGTFTCLSPKTLVLDPSVSVGGGVIQKDSPVSAASATFQSRLYLNGYLFAAALLVGMPFVGFFPLLAGGAVRSLRTRPWRVLFTGTGSVFFLPILIAFVFVTLIGIPLALVLAAFFGILVYLSHIIVALWIGHVLLRSNGPQTFSRVLVSMALGLFALYFLGAFPAVASFLTLPVVVLGTGALVLALLRQPRTLVLPPLSPAIRQEFPRTGDPPPPDGPSA
ncbi:MAG: hypothetical protein LBN38_08185 [Verrucomicrobiota bacterium]|jgi:hypothetical protein|nr:hypothetical protein [Verrucomicrobiota bacterium]